jgi:hypothetical protein
MYSRRYGTPHLYSTLLLSLFHLLFARHAAICVLMGILPLMFYCFSLSHRIKCAQHLINLSSTRSACALRVPQTLVCNFMRLRECDMRLRECDCDCVNHQSGFSSENPAKQLMLVFCDAITNTFFI